MRIGDFLKAAAGDPRPWNCSTLPADWCVARGHADFAAKWRDVVDADECDAASGGNLLALWEAEIGEAMPVAITFSAGDVGIVRRVGMEAGAIFTGERWALRSDRGIACLTLPTAAVLKAWRP